ncbi:hypothetical protein RvY_10274-1 [Ramazzottius varieornatus]|uniref:DDE Tnp4 domain-containing protein n=1 Tax=Ramazzottius varieornatus TaxID=947166 RepID=A0A1D1VGQ9_RAMVA|nr:hypothetical protein RvY_10274-1 [Ramazzottius varieornatus]
MAVARADYTFEYVDVGGFGRQSDGGTSQNCTLGRGFSDGELVMPTARKPPLCAKKLPYVFVADAAFPMSENLLRPYPGYASSSLAKQEHIFNYRLSRAHRVVENAFGILAAKWEIFRGPIALEPQQVIYLTLACCALQNFLITENAKAGDNYISPTLVDSEAADGTFLPGSWRKTMPASMIFLRVSGNRAGRAAIKTREDSSEHFSTHGSIPWQDNMVFGLLNK